MKAMILAAGRGERLRPLTDTIPKPLLPVAGKPVIEYTIESLVGAGFSDIVINLAYLGHKIEAALGNGSRFDATLSYSHEGKTGLETAGGIVYALPLLGDRPFLVVNGDIMTDFPYARLRASPSSPAHIVLVENPPYHSGGDFALENNRIMTSGGTLFTFSGIGVYSVEFFAGCSPGKLPLAPLLRAAMGKGQVSGELYRGYWMDLGTVDRIRQVEEQIKQGVGQQ